jgi:prophage regulatory protein
MDIKDDPGTGRSTLCLPSSPSVYPWCTNPHGEPLGSTFQSNGFAEASSMNAREPVKDGPIRVLRLPQVCDLTGLCRSMIYQMEADERFPKRVKIGIRAVGWLEAEIQAWLRARVQRSRGLSLTSP